MDPRSSGRCRFRQVAIPNATAVASAGDPAGSHIGTRHSGMPYSRVISCTTTARLTAAGSMPWPPLPVPLHPPTMPLVIDVGLPAGATLFSSQAKNSSKRDSRSGRRHRSRTVLITPSLIARGTRRRVPIKSTWAASTPRWAVSNCQLGRFLSTGFNFPDPSTDRNPEYCLSLLEHCRARRPCTASFSTRL